MARKKYTAKNKVHAGRDVYINNFSSDFCNRAKKRLQDYDIVDGADNPTPAKKIRASPISEEEHYILDSSKPSSPSSIFSSSSSGGDGSLNMEKLLKKPTPEKNSSSSSSSGNAIDPIERTKVSLSPLSNVGLSTHFDNQRDVGLNSSAIASQPLKKYHNYNPFPLQYLNTSSSNIPFSVDADADYTPASFALRRNPLNNPQTLFDADNGNSYNPDHHNPPDVDPLNIDAPPDPAFIPPGPVVGNPNPADDVNDEEEEYDEEYDEPPTPPFEAPEPPVEAPEPPVEYDEEHPPPIPDRPLVGPGALPPEAPLVAPVAPPPPPVAPSKAPKTRKAPPASDAPPDPVVPYAPTVDNPSLELLKKGVPLKPVVPDKPAGIPTEILNRFAGELDYLGINNPSRIMEASPDYLWGETSDYILPFMIVKDTLRDPHATAAAARRYFKKIREIANRNPYNKVQVSNIARTLSANSVAGEFHRMVHSAIQHVYEGEPDPLDMARDIELIEAARAFNPAYSFLHDDGEEDEEEDDEWNDE